MILQFRSLYKATSTCSNVSQNDTKELVRASASVRSTITDKMRMVVQFRKKMQIEEEEDARNFIHDINRINNLAKIPIAVQQDAVGSSTTLENHSTSTETIPRYKSLFGPRGHLTDNRQIT